jgi:multiple sugar transport system permease protein
MGGKHKKIRTALEAAGFILPFLIFYSIFTIWPIIQGIYVSFHKWGLMGKIRSVGLDNYTKFLSDKYFWGALRNTTIFSIITVPALIICALILALLANRASKLRKIYRICYYLPNVLSVSVASFTAIYMFSPYRGFINSFLHSIGILGQADELQWLQDSNLVWVTISSMTVWWTVGFSMMIYLSALQDIPEQLYEAADIDGASKRVQLFSIVLPLLKPTTYLVLLLQVIACFKVFGQIYMITNGGPGTSTRPLIQYIYETAFEKNDMGYSSAISYVLFLILVILSLIQIKLRNKEEAE